MMMITGAKLKPAVLVMTASACLLGCDDRRDQVRSYTVPREQAPPVVESAAHPPIALPTGTMRWELPDGWMSIANTNPMRFATLIVGDAPNRVEIAITQLGGAAGGIAANINRWRGQVGLPPAGESELIAISHPIAGRGSVQGIMIDLVGPATGAQIDPPRMLAAIFPSTTHTWFIKTMSTRNVIENHVDGFLTLCESVGFDAEAAPPPPPPSPPAPSAPPGSPTWGALPVGWTADPQPRTMSVGSFTISDGAQDAALTITPLGGNQDLLGNINRWRGQLGLPPLASLHEGPPQAIEIAGAPGSLVDLAGGGRRTLAVMSKRGDQTWFYKLSGPDPLVAGQREAFKTFVRSLRFDGGTP